MVLAPYGGGVVGRLIGDCRRREDLAEQAGEFAPLTVLAAAAHGECERFKAPEGGDFGFEFTDSARRRRLIENLLLGCFDLVIWRILKVFDVFGIERRRCGGDGLGQQRPVASSSSSRRRFCRRSLRRRRDW